MTVITIWHGDDPNEDPSLDEALTRIAERTGDLRYAVEVDETDFAMTHYSADQIADMLFQRAEEMSAGARHEASLVKWP